MGYFEWGYSGAAFEGVMWGELKGAQQVLLPESTNQADATRASFALDQSYVYVVNFGPVVERCPISTSCTAPDRVSGIGGLVAVDQTGTYILDWNVQGDAFVARIVDWNAQPKVIAQNLPGRRDDVGGFLADGGAAFWRTGDEIIYGLQPGATVPRVLVDDPDGIWAIAVDATSVYWASGDGWKSPGGMVKRVGRCGGTPEILVAGQRWSDEFRDPVGIAVGDDALYWLTGTGTVMRMRKLDAPGYSDAGITDADASAKDADGGD